MDKAANGVPLVNIVAPTASGLSHNQYSRFDVNAQGLILNNAERASATQLGGIVGGNPNLGGKAPARVILNEVTGANRSHIEGYVEVAGQKADVILANPQGVTVNGGGFINVDRATVTTGRPEFDGDRLRLRVEGGDVRIDGAGINASNITGFDVVSRAAEINAQVHANDLTVTTGRNDYDPATRQATPLAPGGSAAPTVAIDSTALGGMYAGRITLTSTEKGVGVNLDGVVQSVGDLEITADGRLAVKAAQAGGNMKLEAKNSGLNVKKAAVAEGNLSAQAGRIDIDSEAVLAAGLDLRLEAAQALNLDREAWAVGGRSAEVATDSLTLAEKAALEGGSLKITATTLTADKASLAGGGNLEIYGDSVSLRESSLAAGNVLWLDLDDSLTLDAGSATLGYGGVRVRAASVENRGLIYSGGAAEFRVADSLKNLGGADILTQGDILITGASSNERVGLVRNEQSGIETLGGGIRLEADLFENWGGSTATHEVADGMDYHAIATNFGPDRVMSDRDDLLYKMPNEIYAYMAEQAALHGTPVQGYKKTEGMQEWVYHSHDEMDTPPIPAALIAAGDVVINAGEVRNTLSVISAGNDLFIKADRLVNEGVGLFTHRRTNRWIVSTYWKSGSGWSGGSGRIEGQWFNYHAAETHDTAISLITAGHNVVLNLVAQEGDLIIGDEGDFVGRNHGTPGFLNDYAVSGVGDGGSHAGGLGGLHLPGVGGLFVLSGNPNHPYIIETNPLLTSFGHFYGSEYFLSRMGLDLNRLQAKLLGDAFYEARLIREQIMAMAGTRYLFSGLDDAETIRQLMDNAAEAGQALDLSVGVALTPEQVAALDKDIVWLEEIDYNGQKALVPRLYLSDATRKDLALRGGTISGETVVVQGRGSLATGQIVGDTVKILSTEDIRNRGGDIFGKDSLVVASAGTVRNQSGTLRGNDVLVSAGNDIINETLIERHDKGDTWWSESQQQGLIAATNDLRLEAGNDIRFVGGRAEAGNTAALVAGNDVNLDSKAVEFGHNRKNDTASLIGQAGSFVSGKEVGIQAGRDITLSGSHVAAETNAQLVAGRDLTLLSTQGESHMYSKHTSSGGMGRKRTDILQRDETKALGSSVAAGGNLNLRAGADAAQGPANLTGTAVTLTAGNDLSLTATGDIALGAAEESSYRYDFTSKSSLISAKSHLKESASLTHKGSEISGANVTLHAGDNVLISGSKVAASNDLGLKADTGDVVVASVEDIYRSREEKKKSGFNLGDIGKTLVVGYLTGAVGLSFMDAEFYSKESEKSTRATTVNSGSELSAGHNLRIDANRDATVIGSVVTAENDLGIFAERDVNLVPGRESDQSEYIKKKTSVGMSNSWSENGHSGFVGVTKQESGQKFEGQYSAGSYVGAGNDVVIEAQRDVNQIGSHVEAGRDVVVSAGQDWNMLASYDHENLHEWQKTVQIGISASLRQNVSGAVRTLIDLPENATAGRGGAGYSALTAASAGLRAIDAVKGALSEPISGSVTGGVLLLTHRLPRAFLNRQPVHGLGRARRGCRGRARHHHRRRPDRCGRERDSRRGAGSDHHRRPAFGRFGVLFRKRRHGFRYESRGGRWS
jgi:filamentous hemagglutinin